jgi:hypothetical protein
LAMWIMWPDYVYHRKSSDLTSLYIHITLRG